MSYFECFSVTVTTIFSLNPKLRLFFGYCCTLMKTRLTAAHSYVDPRTIDSLFCVLPSEIWCKITKLLKTTMNMIFNSPNVALLKESLFEGRIPKNLKIDLRHTCLNTALQLVGKKLSSSKELAWSLYTVWHKVLENIRHILWFQ